MGRRVSWAVPLCLEFAPSAVLAGSVGFALAAAAPVAALAAAVPWAAGAGAGIVSWRLLQVLGRAREPFSVEFQPVPFEPSESTGEAELPELLLTQVAAAVDPDSEAGSDALLLVDRVDPAASDSRVVQLFDPARLPTAGELHSRIERHLDGGRPVAISAVDATAELHQALMELRRSLH